MSSISQYKNVFNEPATTQNLSHIFDILNDKNDDRIIFRDFVMHMEHVGLKLDKKAQKKVYDHISSAVKKNRNITKESWVKGINIAHKQANTQKLYTYILGGKQYDPQSGREEIDMEEIRIKLKDTKAPWMYRIECMESLCRQITTSSLKKDKFHEKFRNYHISLTVQAKDRRSNVSRVACEVLAKIILRWTNDFLKYSYTTIEYMYELVRQKIQIVHESGYNVLMVLFKNCGDHKEFKMMDILGREGTTSKFVNLQKDCFDLLHLYLTQQNSNLKSKKGFWDKLLEYTQKGINDTADVRNSALKLLAQIQSEKPQLVGNIVSKMGIHLKKRYESEYMTSNGYNENEQKSDGDWGVSLEPIKKDKNLKSPKGGKSPRTPKTPKKGGKSSANFPKAPKGEFLNGFGERLTDNDMLFAFDFIDFKKDRKITIDEFEICCKRLNVNGNPNTLFSILDEQKSESVTLNTFKSSISKRNSSLMDFWNKLLQGKHLEQSPLSNDIDFDDANKLLLNNKNSENDRLNAMYSITRKICNVKKWDNQDKFDKQFKKSLGPLLNQLKDRNNSIVREVCVCLSKIFIVKRAMYRQFTIRTLENLSEAIKLQDNKIHMSSKQSVAVMIKYIPDRSACPMMKIICDNCCAKNFMKLRSANFEYINYYLFTMIKEFEEKKKVFWEFFEKALKSGLADSDPGVRDLAYIAMVKVEMLKKELAEKYVSTLKKARKEKFNSLKKDELRRIQKGELYSVDGNGSSESKESESMKSAKHKKKKSDKTYKINKRPRDDMSDDEKRDTKREKEKQKREKLAKEKAEKERLEKQKLAKEKERKERLEREKLAKEKAEKERLNKQKSNKQKAEKERLEKQKLQKEKERKEKMEREKLAKQKAEKEKLAREKAEKERLQKEKLAGEKAQKEKLAQEKAEKERLENEKNDKIKYNSAEEERREKIRKMKEEERRDRLERQKKEKEKLESEKKEEEVNENKQKAAKNELEKKKAERERLQAEKLAKQQKETRDKVAKLKEEQRKEKEEEKRKLMEGGDYGFPTVHEAAKKYYEEKGVKCTNATHLVLYAKKLNMDGVGFSSVSKYFKAQK